MKNKKIYISLLWLKTKKKLISIYEGLLAISFSPEKRAELMLLSKKALIALIKVEVNKK